jgi:hypothetical protein
MAHILKFDQKIPPTTYYGFLRNSAVFKVDMAHILKFDQKIPTKTYYGFFTELCSFRG